MCRRALTREHLGTPGLLLMCSVTVSSSLDPRALVSSSKSKVLPAQIFSISVAAEGWELGKDVGGAYERLVFPFWDSAPLPEVVFSIQMTPGGLLGSQ